MYNDIVQDLSSTPTFLAMLTPGSIGGAAVSLKVAAVSEFTAGAFIGESYDDGRVVVTWTYQFIVMGQGSTLSQLG